MAVHCTDYSSCRSGCSIPNRSRIFARFQVVHKTVSISCLREKGKKNIRNSEVDTERAGCSARFAPRMQLVVADFMSWFPYASVHTWDRCDNSLLVLAADFSASDLSASDLSLCFRSGSRPWALLPPRSSRNLLFDSFFPFCHRAPPPGAAHWHKPNVAFTCLFAALNANCGADAPRSTWANVRQRPWDVPTTNVDETANSQEYADIFSVVA